MTNREAEQVLGALAGEPLPWMRKGVRVCYRPVYSPGMYVGPREWGVCTARGPKLFRILWDGAPKEELYYWYVREVDNWYDTWLTPGRRRGRRKKR